MRNASAALITAVLLAASAPAQAGFVAQSTYTGTVTQAPAGNVFAVTTGASVLGHVFFPVGPVKTGTVSDFEIGLFIGTGHYVLDAAGGNDTVTLTNGLISAIDVTFPNGPCIPGSAAICPGVIYSGAEFFTDAPAACSAGAVCGTLDFTGSAPGPIPEPATVLLLAASLLGLGLAAVRRARVPSPGSDRRRTYRLLEPAAGMSKGFAVVAVLLAGLFTETARAAPISYVFAAGTTTDLGAGAETITGSFTFDASTDTETNVSITLTGMAPFADTYTDPLATPPSSNEVFGFSPTLTGISIFFAMPLDVSPDPLMEVRFGNVKLAAVDPSPHGAAIFQPAIPEPASLSLLGTALGLFLLTAWANRGARRSEGG
jgi:hypothetical protein